MCPHPLLHPPPTTPPPTLIPPIHRQPMCWLPEQKSCNFPQPACCQHPALEASNHLGDQWALGGLFRPDELRIEGWTLNNFITTKTKMITVMTIKLIDNLRNIIHLSIVIACIAWMIWIGAKKALRLCWGDQRFPWLLTNFTLSSSTLPLSASQWSLLAQSSPPSWSSSSSSSNQHHHHHHHHRHRAKKFNSFFHWWKSWKNWVNWWAEAGRVQPL